MAKIMLIDDDEDLHLIMQRYARSEGYDFCGAYDGASGLKLIESERPDILLLDVMMPIKNGFEVCQIIRESGRRIPIIFLTAKGDMVDKKIGFKAGGDDYVAKPFDIEELFLRVEAHLRRRADDLLHSRVVDREGSVIVGDLEICFSRYEALLTGELVCLTPREFEILALLATSPGKVFTREQICNHLWGEEDGGSLDSVPVYIRKIREKIEKDPSKPKYLLTVWSVGYKLNDRV